MSSGIKTAGAIIIILGIAFFIFSTVLILQESEEIKEVDCYDNYNNKIQGATCEEEFNVEQNIMGAGIFSLFIFVVGAVFLTVEI